MQTNGKSRVIMKRAAFRCVFGKINPISQECVHNEEEAMRCHAARGRPRQPSGHPDQGCRQAGSSLWRKIPHHRFSALQLHQFGHRRGRRFDAVSSAGAERLYRFRLSVGSRPVQRRRLRPAAVSDRQDRRMVQGHGQRHLSEHSFHRSVGPGVRAGALRRPHL